MIAPVTRNSLLEAASTTSSLNTGDILVKGVGVVRTALSMCGRTGFGFVRVACRVAMERVAPLPTAGRARPRLVTRWRPLAVAVALSALLARSSTSKVFACGLRFSVLGPPTRQLWQGATISRAAVQNDDNDIYYGKAADPVMTDDEGVVERDVKVTDQRDVNELLRLSNPVKPTLDMRLHGITLADGKRIDMPTMNDLRALKPSRLAPVIFHWRDRSKSQTRAPKQYDDIIQRLLNAGPGAMEELVRANWKMFDRAFFFRLTELKEDATDEGLKGRISSLYSMALDVVKAAQDQMRKQLPLNAKDAREILDSMLESDQKTLLWPAPPEAYTRLAESIKTRATRAKYDDSWFETTIEIVERYTKKMDIQRKVQLLEMGQAIMQRLVTEWLRHDSLWEETAEGRFLFRLMNITDRQWAEQLAYELSPLDGTKLRDELKIISENKIVRLPMGSKLQVYAAKYVQGLVEFVAHKDVVLRQKEEMRQQAMRQQAE